MHLYGNVVIYNLTLTITCTMQPYKEYGYFNTAYVRYLLYTVIYCKQVHYTANLLAWDLLRFGAITVYTWLNATLWIIVTLEYNHSRFWNYVNKHCLQVSSSGLCLNSCHIKVAQNSLCMTSSKKLKCLFQQNYYQ